jgi:hypothetical protein
MLTVSPGLLAAICFDDLQPVAPDGLVGGHVLIADVCCAGIGRFQPVFAWQVAHTAEHFIERPHQVDGRGPGPAQAGVSRFQCFVRGIFAQGEAHAIGRGRADQGCAAYLHHLYGAGGVFKRFQRDDLELVRQPGLVDDVDPPAVRVQPDRAVMGAVDFHSLAFFWRLLAGGKPVPTFPEASLTRLRSLPAGAP